MKTMVRRLMVVTLAAAGAMLAACSSSAPGSVPSAGNVQDDGTVGSQGKIGNAPMLNLSHIECNGIGTVDVHFVLLFAGNAQPGTLTGTYDGGTPFGPVASDAHTGNVWHYDVTLPSGNIDIESAQVTTGSGTLVTLHNPDTYVDDYQCGQPPPTPTCSVQVTAQDQICLDHPLGNETDECAYFGLALIGKDIPTTQSNEFTSTTDAYLAIVKTGTGSCGPGYAAYRTYVDVTVGEQLYAPGGQAVSHVTYCRCPDGL